MNRLSKVDVMRPPKITTAIGCSTSCPGTFPATTSGTSASPVVRAVIRIGTSRSRARRRTNPSPKSSSSSSSSSSSRC